MSLSYETQKSPPARRGKNKKGRRSGQGFAGKKASDHRWLARDWQSNVLALADAGPRWPSITSRVRRRRKKSAEMPRNIGVQAHTYRADISHEEEAKQMVDAILADLAPSIFWSNNAGITRDKTFLKMTRSLWDEVLGVNLTACSTSPARCCREWWGGWGV